MRHFIYFSTQAPTSGKAISNAQGNLMKAGRLDIAIHSFIQAVYLSEGIRDNVVFHFVFYGMPEPPKHIEIQVKEETPLSKKDVIKVLKKLLYKCQEGVKKEVLPGCFVEKKGFADVVADLVEKGSDIFILDKKGDNIRKIEILENPVFIIGDHEGLPKKEVKKLKNIARKISIGDKTYFASQTIAVLNNELDYRGI